MITLTTLLIIITIAATALTAAMGFLTDRVKNYLITFLQNFCGALFIFSGAVKAIDPLGTAYKMEQYFAQFESTFSETWMSFIAPLFPWMSSMSVGFSVFMVVFEIVLGIMLIIGSRPKLTAWLFFLLVLFFTALTGFTYLTGYVPMGGNFFDFGIWGGYKESQMLVTDCGCFGDFLKLEPFVSFMKDVFLMIPATIFLFAHRQFHRIFNRPVRAIIVGVSTLALWLFCLSNYAWDLPMVDFRPFHEGADIRNEKIAQDEAMANVNITHYIATNKESGQSVKIPYDQYLKEFRDYPKAEWDLEQLKDEPAIPSDKISEFEVMDVNGNDVTDEILDEAGYSIMLVAMKIKDTKMTEEFTVNDTTFVVDTIRLVDFPDSITTVRRVDKVTPRQVTKTKYKFDDKYIARYTDIVNPIMEKAMEEGVKVYAITAPSDEAKIDDFRHATQSAYPMHTADDILLKTIIRSNPGIVLMHDGKILRKWHVKHMPTFAEIKAAMN